MAKKLKVKQERDDNRIVVATKIIRRNQTEYRKLCDITKAAERFVSDNGITKGLFFVEARTMFSSIFVDFAPSCFVQDEFKLRKIQSSDNGRIF